MGSGQYQKSGKQEFEKQKKILTSCMTNRENN